METPHLEQTPPETSLFKEHGSKRLNWLLEGTGIDRAEVLSLAVLIAKNDEVLYKTYHNLFTLQQEESAAYIQALKEGYEFRKREITPGTHEYDQLQFEIDVASSLIDFTEKHGWHYAHNATRFLEENLK